MASAELVVTVATEWRWEAGDGTVCFVCGDHSYLKQRRLMVQAGDYAPQPTPHVLCVSCGELLEAK